MGTTLSAEARPQHAGSPAVLSLEGVSKSFGGFRAIDGIDLQFAAGAVYGIIGPNGAGKTTLFHLLSGFLKPSTGRLRHRGTDITALAPEAIARRGIVRSFQITSIFANLTIAENLVVPIQRREGGGGRFWTRSRWRHDHAAEIDDLLLQVGIPPEWRDRPASSLPYGQKRSLELGISLAARPDLLLLDEPTAGMTVSDIGRITELIGRIAAGRTVIVVEHNLGVIADLAQEIVVMQQGRLLTRGRYDEVRRDQRVIDAYLGNRGRRVHA